MEIEFMNREIKYAEVGDFIVISGQIFMLCKDAKGKCFILDLNGNVHGNLHGSINELVSLYKKEGYEIKLVKNESVKLVIM